MKENVLQKAAVIFLVNPENKLLMHLRDNKRGIPYPGYWCLIGGAIEEDETPAEAMHREIKEEIGCNVSGIMLLETLVSPDRKLLFIFSGIIKKKAGEIHLTEGQKVDYFTVAEILRLRTPKFMKEFIVNNKNCLLNRCKQ